MVTDMYSKCLPHSRKSDQTGLNPKSDSRGSHHEGAFFTCTSLPGLIQVFSDEEQESERIHSLFFTGVFGAVHAVNNS